MEFRNKLKYSKCPNCKKHGITAFFKIGRGTNSEVTCKHCGKVFKVNWAFSFIMKISIGIFWGIVARIFDRYVMEIPLWVWIAPIVISFFVMT